MQAFYFHYVLVWKQSGVDEVKDRQIFLIESYNQEGSNEI